MIEPNGTLALSSAERHQFARPAADLLFVSAAARYQRDLLRYVQARHVAGRLVNLADILVEPRLIPAVSAVNPPDDETEERGVYDVVCDRGLMTREQLDRLLNPEAMTAPRAQPTAQ